MRKSVLFVSLIVGLIIVSVISYFYFKNWDQQNNISHSSESQEKSTENGLCLIEVPERNKEQKYEILSKLSSDVQVDYFIRMLGCPIYINYTEDKLFKEYVFIDDEYFVQTITNPNNKVFTYAVTSRKKDFNPTFKMEGLFEVSLNKTPFSEWRIDNFRELPLSCYFFLGAHDPIYYFEEDYFGNPGHYLSYLIGINNSATYNGLPKIEDAAYDNLSDREMLALTMGPIKCEKVNKDDRKKLTPNTFIVREFMSNDKDSKDYPGIWFGPRNVQLRKFND